MAPSPAAGMRPFHAAPPPHSAPVWQSRPPTVLDSFRDKWRQWQYATDPQIRGRLLDELLALITADNAAELVPSLSSDELDAAAGNAVLERWLALDPRAAAQWAAGHGGNQGPVATLVAREFLKTPDGFSAYCAQLPDGAWKQAVLGAASAEMAAQNPAEAVALAQQMDSGDAQAGRLQSAAFEWGRQDPAAAIAQLKLVTDADLREQMIASAAKGFAEKDPARAADWLVASVKSESRLNDAAAYIVRSWAASEPRAAADWVSQFPAGPVLNEALENLISQWTSADYPAAAAWSAQLPDSPFRSQAKAILDRFKPPSSSAK